MSPEEFVKNCGGLVVDRAMYYHRLYGYALDPRDVVQEGFRIGLEALRRYDPGKGSLTSFIYSSLKNYHQFFRRELKSNCCLDENLENRKGFDFEKYMMEKYVVYNLMMNDLDEDGKEVLDWILFTNHGKRFKKVSLFRHFVGDKGWRKCRLDRAWNEVKRCYNKYIRR